MKSVVKSLWCSTFVGLVLFSISFNLFAQDSSKFLGDWEGRLDAGSMILRIVFHIEDQNGVYIAKLDSPDQNAFGIKADNVDIVGNKITIGIAQIMGKYDGELDSDGIIKGTWSQGPKTLLLNLAKPGQAIAEEEKNFISYWQGNLTDMPTKLTVNLKIFKEKDGTLNALLDSPDQGVYDLKTADFVMNDDSMKFNVPAVTGSYSGKVVKDSSLIEGIWKQGAFESELNLHQVDKIEKLKRPQRPEKPYPYNDEDVSFENKEAGITLAGSFTFPKTGGPFPAVVLITGSGAQDRDETIFNHKPFLVISDYLTRNGIAVLRFDDRGVGKSKGNFAAATTVDFAQDAISAVEYLKTRKEVNPKEIGIIGHSEGGIIAPMAASNSSDVAFIVLLAGPGLPGKDILLMQQELIYKAEGMDEKTIEENHKLNEKLYNVIDNEPDSAKAVKKLEAAFDEYVNSLPEEERNKPQYTEEGRDQVIKTLINPWFRFFLKYDPRPVLESITIPVLALDGSNDLQVPPKEDLAEISKALKAAGNKNFEVKELPGLNHLFQDSKTGSPSEYGKIEETFSPDALKIIGDWILEVTKK